MLTFRKVVLMDKKLSILEAKSQYLFGKYTSGNEGAYRNIIMIESLMKDPNDFSKEIIQAPYLPKHQEKPYTLVLDLDETLIHFIEFEDEGSFLQRPFLHEFLDEVSKSYEIVIFTAALQDVSSFS
jgi:hypothetical protein